MFYEIDLRARGSLNYAHNDISLKRMDVMGDLSKIFSKAYADSKVSRATYDLGDGHKEQLKQLQAVIADLNEDANFHAHLEMQGEYLQLHAKNARDGTSLRLDVQLIGDGTSDRYALMFERPECRHSGVGGDNIYDLREQQGREDLCRQLARAMCYEIEPPFVASLRSYAKKPPAP